MRGDAASRNLDKPEALGGGGRLGKLLLLSDKTSHKEEEVQLQKPVKVQETVEQMWPFSLEGGMRKNRQRKKGEREREQTGAL